MPRRIQAHGGEHVVEYLRSVSELCLTMPQSLLLTKPASQTLVAEGSSLSWAIFFCGCKKIARFVHTPNQTYEGAYALIVDWIFYHDVMYKFTIAHWVQRNWDQVGLAEGRKILSKAVFSPQRQVVRSFSSYPGS